MQANQFGVTLPLDVPLTPGIGRIMLSNGRELIGTWGWISNLMLALFTETSGVQWVIDVNQIVAFSPITETPIPEAKLPEAVNAQQYP